MANSLNRTLKKNDRLIMRNGRHVILADGETFGCIPSLLGRCILVEYNGETVRTSGYDIDADATVKRYAEKNGWKK